MIFMTTFKENNKISFNKVMIERRRYFWILFPLDLNLTLQRISFGVDSQTIWYLHIRRQFRAFSYICLFSYFTQVCRWFLRTGLCRNTGKNQKPSHQRLESTFTFFDVRNLSSNFYFPNLIIINNFFHEIYMCIW